MTPRACEDCGTPLPEKPFRAKMQTCPTCIRLNYYEDDGSTRLAHGGDTVLLSKDDHLALRQERKRLADLQRRAV